MANDEVIKAWNELLAPKFIRFRHVFVDSAKRHSDVAFARHPPRTGERALDIGCGFGETSLELARMVGPSGSVVGLDPCEPFLAHARADARDAGASNVTFVAGDAQTHAFDAPFDYAFSRFGVMFFSDPTAALSNLRRALRPGARFVALTWRALDDNPWLAVPKAVALRHLPPPPDAGTKGGPGPFSMSDPEVVRAVWERAGFTRVALERVDAEVPIGRDLDDAVDAQLSLGPAGQIVRVAEQLGEQRRPALARDLRAALEPHVTGGKVFMPSSSWCVTATNGT
jgi:ubiquinone/menaquinone biosynthesis C-methylase UbiE